MSLGGREGLKVARGKFVRVEIIKEMDFRLERTDQKVFGKVLTPALYSFNRECVWGKTVNVLCVETEFAWFFADKILLEMVSFWILLVFVILRPSLNFIALFLRRAVWYLARVVLECRIFLQVTKPCLLNFLFPSIKWILNVLSYARSNCHES